MLRVFRRLGQRTGCRFELARRRGDGFDDIADGGFEFVGKFLHLGAAAFGGLSFRFLLPCAQLLAFDETVLECLHGTPERADLVLATGIGLGHRQVA